MTRQRLTVAGMISTRRLARLLSAKCVFGWRAQPVARPASSGVQKASQGLHLPLTVHYPTVLCCAGALGSLHR